MADEFVTKELCEERSGNIIEKVADLKDTVEKRFEHINTKLDKLLNGNNKKTLSYKLWLAIIAGINGFIIGMVELIKAIAK